MTGLFEPDHMHQVLFFFRKKKKKKWKEISEAEYELNKSSDVKY